MLVAPTEPPQLRRLGRTSLLPEHFGCDVLWTRRGGKVGVQRKEVKDLLASVEDGRLAKEVAQMAGRVDALLVVEGKIRWRGGHLDVRGGWGRDWTRPQLEGLLWSVQARGVAVSYSDDIAGTVELVGWWKKWHEKARHEVLDRRPGPGAGTGIWGRGPDDHDLIAWMLQAIPGVGAETARKIIDEVGVPVMWRDGVDVDALCRVPGIGEKKAKRILKVLEREKGK